MLCYYIATLFHFYQFWAESSNSFSSSSPVLYTATNNWMSLLWMCALLLQIHNLIVYLEIRLLFAYKLFLSFSFSRCLSVCRLKSLFLFFCTLDGDASVFSCSCSSPSQPCIHKRAHTHTIDIKTSKSDMDFKNILITPYKMIRSQCLEERKMNRAAQEEKWQKNWRSSHNAFYIRMIYIKTMKESHLHRSRIPPQHSARCSLNLIHFNSFI